METSIICSNFKNRLNNISGAVTKKRATLLKNMLQCLIANSVYLACFLLFLAFFLFCLKIILYVTELLVRSYFESSVAAAQIALVIDISCYPTFWLSCYCGTPQYYMSASQKRIWSRGRTPSLRRSEPGSRFMFM